ncbi:zinc ribbon domain-containing protein [Akkermansia sp. N21169]|uniref:zinc ribbon domain-containing protein n=1 Tax=Akkermansia sp. N21169 TaxID=3040765 RepID=UPI00244EA42A|nr:zinc ribbon domain-containing protein [Akkermansia sp. N21169]MDH3069385.1 zinc ribbon domain-containing protein [Akkermansia sp. N21169]
MKGQKYLNLFCQSCGMPMHSADQFGTDKDGSANRDYCCYCYKDGEFVQDCSMEGMIEHCIKYLDEFNASSGTQLSKDEAIAEMRKYFPRLKRWAK